MENDSWRKYVEDTLDKILESQESMDYEINFLKKLYYNVVRKLGRTADFSMETRSKVIKIEKDRVTVKDLGVLVDRIEEHFNDSELYDVMLHFNCLRESFPEQFPKAVYEFVMYLHRRRKIRELQYHLEDLRPFLNWQTGEYYDDDSSNFSTFSSQ